MMGAVSVVTFCVATDLVRRVFEIPYSSRTLTMSPNKLLTSRYMSRTPSHLSQMPMLLHCTIRLEYCPPAC